MSKADTVRLIAIGDVVLKSLAVAGIASLVWAVVNERRMQRHRQPGVTYGAVTLRRDGGWRRSDLFTAEGLVYQRRASMWGVIGVTSLLLAVLAAWAIGYLRIH